MKVFFTVSYYGKDKYQKYYDMIRQRLEDIKDVDLISPEIGNYKNVLSPKERLHLDSKDAIHYAAIRRGIDLADVVIIDITHEDFQLGHEATLAMERKKPVLVLSLYKDMSKLVLHPYLCGAQYDETSIDEILKNFIFTHSKNLLNQRFNMFLSRRQMDLLEQKAKAFGVTKSEFIRRVIEQ